MAFDNYWTAREVIALRHALRRGPYAFADYVGVTPRSVLCWEDGTTKRIRAASQELLDDALKRAGPEVRVRFDRILSAPHAALAIVPDAPMIADAPDTGTRMVSVAAQEVEDDDVDRRNFANTVMGMSALALTEWRSPHTGQIRLTDANRLAAIVDEFANKDQHIGGAALIQEAHSRLNEAKYILETGHFDNPAGVAFTSATGRMADRVGWLAFDADDHHAARANYSDALALANLASDDELTAYVCLNMAMQQVNLSHRTGSNGKPLGSPHHALRLVDRARQLSRSRPHGRIHALIAVRDATAHATKGDRIGFNHSIAAAWREMDQATEAEPLNECATGLRFMSHAEVLLHEAKGHAYLGDMSTATEKLSIVSGYRSNPRNAAAYRASYAATLAQTGERTTAIDEASTVLSQLEHGVSSTRTLRTLEPVRVAACSGNEGEEFAHRFDQLNRAMTIK